MAEPGAEVTTSAFFLTGLTIYVGLIVLWGNSVYRRLLPTRARDYTIAAAGMMLLAFLVRTVAYRIADSDLSFRLAWYCAYIPYITIPLLFLFTCRDIERRGSARWDWLLALTAAALILGILTNDLHFLAFRPYSGGTAHWDGKDGTYDYGPLFWLVTAWIAGTALGGMALMIRADRQYKKRQVITWTAAILSLDVFFLLLYGDFFPALAAINPYRRIEVFCFSALGLWESCIRNRLIPRNENYAAFFSDMSLPIAITDRQFRLLYRTAAPFEASAEQMRSALDRPLLLDENTRLSGKPVQGGYAFWTEDVSAVNQINEQLREANQTLAEENDLIHAENALREKRALVESRNSIYNEISAALYPCQRRIRDALMRARPGTEDFRRTVTQTAVMNAYVKRRTNLMLLAAEEGRIRAQELRLSIEESVRYLNLHGVHSSVEGEIGGLLCREEALAVYDSFEMLMEKMLPEMTQLLVSLSDTRIRLTVEGRKALEAPRLPEAPLPFAAEVEEGTLYLAIPMGREGDRECR